MDIKLKRADLDGAIILGQGYQSELYNFVHYSLCNESDNFYNAASYGWNWTVEELNRTFTGLKFKVYIINAYRNEPHKCDRVNYFKIDKYFKKQMKLFNAVEKAQSWKEQDSIRKIYIKRITKWLNKFLENSF